MRLGIFYVALLKFLTLLQSSTYMPSNVFSHPSSQETT